MFFPFAALETLYKPDLVVFEGIVVERKAVAQLLPEHEAQLSNYMRSARRQVGCLLNFGCRTELEWKRFILTELHGEKQEH